MQVTVRLGEPLTRSVGALRVSLQFDSEPATVAGALHRLSNEYPGFDAAFRGEGIGHVNPYRVYVNARQVPAGDEDRWRLVDGDKIYIFLPAAGGQDAPLPQAFYARPTLTVARDLLGRRLVRCLDGQRLSGRIAEVEAYIGEDDRASHAAPGRTKRNRPMYGAPGLAYVYFIYGMYFCLNVVTETEGFPAAILIRGIEPDEGIAAMAARRAGRLRNLADGPGKLCQAMAIDRALNCHDLTAGRELWIEPGESVADGAVSATPRINVRGDETAINVLWRLVARLAAPD
ncbi:MAG: DNA-3-methyladenine glycosylase [Anaerolineae bacterium]|nr:DNA-3-methyladenine glycosylase [Anaerolineae bacterium]